MCTLQKIGHVYLLTLTGAGDHRLDAPLLSSLRSAVASVAASHLAAGRPSGAALVTAGEGKFFSNGFDLAWDKLSPSEGPLLMFDAFKALIADLLSLPMPTVAAVTGHAAAGGCILALAHDYVLMRADRGFLYMSEIEIGIPVGGYFMALLRAKIGVPRVLRDLVLAAARVPAARGVELGIVDRAVEGPVGKVVEAAVMAGEELAARNWDGQVYAEIRKGAFREAAMAVGLVVDEDGVKGVVSKL